MNFQPNLIYWAFYITLGALILPGALIALAGWIHQKIHPGPSWLDMDSHLTDDPAPTLLRKQHDHSKHAA